MLSPYLVQPEGSYKLFPDALPSAHFACRYPFCDKPVLMSKTHWAKLSGWTTYEKLEMPGLLSLEWRQETKIHSWHCHCHLSHSRLLVSIRLPIHLLFWGWHRNTDIKAIWKLLSALKATKPQQHINKWSYLSQSSSFCFQPTEGGNLGELGEHDSQKACTIQHCLWVRG